MSPQSRQMIAIGGLVACLLIAGAIVYFLLFGTSPHRRTVEVDPKQQTGGMGPGFRVQPPPRRQEAVVRERDDLWTVRGNIATMSIQTKDDKTSVVIHHTRHDFLNPDQVALVSGIFRARHDPTMAKEWGISDQQLEQLKTIKLNVGNTPLEGGQRDEMLGLWNDWNKASGPTKTDAEKKLVTRVDELARANLDSDRKTFINELDAAKKILTADQLQKLTQR